MSDCTLKIVHMIRRQKNDHVNDCAQNYCARIIIKYFNKQDLTHCVHLSFT